MCRQSGSLGAPKLSSAGVPIIEDSVGLLSETASSRSLPQVDRAAFHNFLHMYGYESSKSAQSNPLTRLRGGAGRKFSPLAAENADTQHRTFGVSAFEAAESEHQGAAHEVQNGLRSTSLPDNGLPSSTDGGIPHSVNNDATRTASDDAEDQPKVLSASEALKAVWRTLVAPPPTTEELQNILKGQHAGYVRAPGAPSATVPSVDSNGKCALFCDIARVRYWGRCTVWFSEDGALTTIPYIPLLNLHFNCTLYLARILTQGPR
jgi:hypothetical protein